MWLKAVSAMELKNYGYAIQLLQGVLKSYPEFLLARQLARKAAVSKSAGKKGASIGGSFSTMKVQSLVKKDPVAALAEVEKILELDPFSGQANQALKEAAIGAKMPEIAIFALETIIEGNPKDTKTMHELAKLYLANSLPRKAVDVYSRILEVTPNDLAAVKGGKDAAAAESMQRGGWEKEEATYRDLIANKDEAVALEQKGRVHRDEEMIDNLLAELSQKYQQDSQNVDTARKIAELLEQKGDFKTAVEWYTYAAGLTGNSDVALVRKASDLQLKQYDAEIADYESRIAASPDSEENPQLLEKLEESRRNRAGYLLDEAKRRVDRNPTDLQLRYELGEILVNLANYKDAIAELQKARNNPNVRLRAMNLLGRCYTERGMFDLAAKTLSDAASELSQMDSTKKDIVYNLGLVYEKMGQKEKSVDCMKQIYEIDYGYRDVADRVEGSYGEAA